MDMSRVKNILIIVFLIINLMLYVFYHSMNTGDVRVEAEAINNIKEILGRQNIILNAEIPSSTSDVKVCYIDRVIQSEKSFIEKLMGEYTVEDEDVYTAEDKSLSIVGGEIVFVDNSGTYDVINPLNMSNSEIQRYCETVIPKYGISLNDTIFKGINKVGDNVKAIFAYKFDKYEIIDAYVIIELSTKGVAGIRGKNIVLRGVVEDGVTEVLSVSDILIKFMREIDIDGRVEIINISYGYYIGRGALGYKSVVAIPVYQIAVDTGEIYHYDARNGTFVE